eukprot:1161516-Pelagomonas_calceolata.AAC.9
MDRMRMKLHSKLVGFLEQLSRPSSQTTWLKNDKLTQHDCQSVYTVQDYQTFRLQAWHFITVVFITEKHAVQTQQLRRGWCKLLSLQWDKCISEDMQQLLFERHK